jgi:hypothetical protein
MAQQGGIVMSTAPTRSANLFQVHGRHLHITYSTTSFIGTPQFTYQDVHGVQDFQGDQIRSLESEIGTLVTVTIAQTVDRGGTSFTLLVPRVNLDQAPSVPISTEGITTLHRFSNVPAFNHGQTELYTVTRLTGTASAVEF